MNQAMALMEERGASELRREKAVSEAVEERAADAEERCLALQGLLEQAQQSLAKVGRQFASKTACG